MVSSDTPLRIDSLIIGLAQVTRIIIVMTTKMTDPSSNVVVVIGKKNKLKKTNSGNQMARN